MAVHCCSWCVYRHIVFCTLHTQSPWQCPIARHMCGSESCHEDKFCCCWSSFSKRLRMQVAGSRGGDRPGLQHRSRCLLLWPHPVGAAHLAAALGRPRSLPGQFLVITRAEHVMQLQCSKQHLGHHITCQDDVHVMYMIFCRYHAARHSM